jgi:WD40 repeat protein
MTLTGHRGCINTCSFNPYGDFELTGCDDGCVWLWDIGNRCATPKLILRSHITNVFTTNFLSHSRFVSGANDATVQVIDVLPDGSVRATVYAKHHIRKVHGSFVIDQNTFATCAHDGTIRLFDVRTPYRNQRTVPLPTLTEANFN